MKNWKRYHFAIILKISFVLIYYASTILLYIHLFVYVEIFWS